MTLKIACPICSLVLLAMAACVSVATAAEPDGVSRAVDRGVAYLRGQQRPDGTWPRNEVGATALAALTLLECQVPADDPAVRKAADVVRRAAVKLSDTYSVSLSLLLLDRLGDPDDVPLIESLGVRLLAGQTSFGGWGYGCPELPEAETQRLTSLLGRRQTATARPASSELPRARRTERDLSPEIQEQLRLLALRSVQSANERPGPDDNSNTQFATLALWVAHRHGLPVGRAVTLLYGRFWVSMNLVDGGWGYSFYTPSLGDRGRPASTAPMTCAGLLGLAVAHGVAGEVTLRAVPAAQLGTTPARRPDDPTKDPAIRIALFALGTTVGQPVGASVGLRQVPILPTGGKAFYFLWSVERVAMAYGLDQLGKKDWYAWGAEILVANQQADGSWQGEYATGGVDTCFALLFLRRANLASDLTATLKGKVSDPTAAVLRAGGVGGEGLPGQAAPGLPAPDPEAARLSNDLIDAAPARQGELLARYEQSKGALYTDALASAIPRLTGAMKSQARDVLADRLARMTSQTLGEKLRDESPEVRRAAALACCMKDDRGHIPRLIELLEDPKPAVPPAAYAALKGLSGQDFGPAANASPAQASRAVASWKAWWAGQEGR